MSDTILVIIQYVLSFFAIVTIGAYWSKVGATIIDGIIASKITDKEIEDKTKWMIMIQDMHEMILMNLMMMSIMIKGVNKIYGCKI